ncbi:hypothetical protein O3M35_000653 [Rhynocoris fuscipes]|uniref:Uncharacterized protein n=1 Tax=Rhynocoris fuscipes TaxID=488301 RepID=A0AAW1DPH7_9HEMI
MCPLWPLHIIILYLLAICPLWFVACTLAPKVANQVWGVVFSPAELKELPMLKTAHVIATTKDFQDSLDVRVIKALVGDPDIISVEPDQLQFKKEENSTSWIAEFNVTGKFLGYTSVSLCEQDKDSVKSEDCLKKSEPLKVSVGRDNRVLDRIFTGSVITLVSIIFINFGCALEFRSLKQAIIRPVGPLIGLICHFLFMPLVSYGLGELLFPESRPLRLGLFFTGVSPAGGASNIWTFVLGGNINLSVTMTAVSTLASFAFIPLWVFTLGPVILSGGELEVPYSKIITSAVGLLIPLCIGYALQIYCKKVSNVMVRILKPFSALLIIFIIVFAIVTNFYLFKLFNWQILLAGFSIPCLGYIAGWISASTMKQSPEDKLAISIETGVQNTGVAIFLLRSCLTQPAADITTVAPVAVALMTPIPVLCLYLIRRFTNSNVKSEEKLPTLSDDNLHV